MTRPIERIAVIGAGVMGASIAAHLVNAQFSVDLLDIVPQELTSEEQAKGLALSHPAVRNRIVTKGIEVARRSKPAAFFISDWAERVRNEVRPARQRKKRPAVAVPA